MTTTATTLDTDRAGEAAAAAASLLPSVNPLSVAAAQPGNEDVAAAFQAAVVSRLSGGGSARIGILVGAELVEALAASPTPDLQLAAALQPAIDAAAQVLGSSAEGAVQVDPAAVVAELGSAFVTVPLIGTGFAAAVVLTDSALTPGPASGAPAVEEQAAFAALPVVGPQSATHAPSAGPVGSVARRGIEMLHGVDMELTVELGRTRMAVRDLLALSHGDVLELDRAAGSPADLLVNGRLIARGEVVVVDEDFGLRITQILDADAV
jgi:flagellar motor switch protein FliN/FliY